MPWPLTAIVMATRVAGNKEGAGNGSKSNGNDNWGRRKATAMRALAEAPMWVMATAMRVAGDKEGKGEGVKG